MVISDKGGERTAKELMAMRTERSKQLHNFRMPCLKWGNQRFLRCMKVNLNGEVSAAATDRSSSGSELENGLIGRRRELEPDWRGWIERDQRKESFKNSSSPTSGAGASGLKSKAKSGGDDGIEAVREKLMSDLQTEADKMKVAILREGLKETSTAAAAAASEAEAARPWNLRTRRAACKVPNAMNGAIGAGGTKSLKVDERRANHSPLRTDSKSPRLRGDAAAVTADGPTGEKRGRAKFSVSLSRREIEEDFMVMAGHRPHRRPKKRPKIVQNQLDTLFPGLWLTEVTADIYKVADDPENGRR
ncbi:hypothetical protein U1Q18_045640 [Sarracenia purpurea var. burkii]